MMKTYTWGYIKQATLAKLHIDEEQATQLGWLNNFPFWANEAMSQICAVKPAHLQIDVCVKPKCTEEGPFVGDELSLPDDFFAFDDTPATLNDREAYDDVLSYHGNGIVVPKYPGHYVIPYLARWCLFDAQNNEDIEAEEEIVMADGKPVPPVVLDALPAYLAAQCYKIDDETKSAICRNEFEMALARLEDTDFSGQRTFTIGGGW